MLPVLQNSYYNR